jgi:hypothetical protein
VNPKKLVSLAATLTIGLGALMTAGAAQAFNFGDMMNPGRWFGGDRDRYYDRYDRGYGWGGPYGGYGGPYGYGGGTKEHVEAAIKGYVEPHLGRDLVSANCVKGIAIEGDQVKVNVVLGFPAKGIADTVKAAGRGSSHGRRRASPWCRPTCPGRSRPTRCRSP